jgi:lipopolysaccharide biosynthesis protein
LSELTARLIAFYLPQFHPIPENDVWWGKGFTEWTNVARARPLFPGHYQPHIPADLGFYDLRVPETRVAQAELAREYCIEAFCYYHYWFKGKRLLESPFDQVLASGEPDFPFCLAWANESWSRRWLGEEKQILQRQTYSQEDDFNHIRWLIRAFADPRYLRVKGRPLFLIYRPTDLPDARRTTEIFRNECSQRGMVEPYLVGINAHCAFLDCRTIGFDGTLNFDPQLGALPDFMNDRASLSKWKRNRALGVRSSSLKLYEDAEARERMLNLHKDFPTIPSVFVGWDNSPRRGRNGIIVVRGTPGHFERRLAQVAQSVQVRPLDERLVFLNAWNEWAEGNHLEPDLKDGREYLEAVRRVTAQLSIRNDDKILDRY